MSIEPEYVTARSVLLDGLDALHEHLPEIVLIGAQAVYLWAGAGDLRVAVMTTDADLALDASALKPNPRVEAALEVAGFAQRPGGNPGQWINRNGVALDLMVAEHQAGGGSRAAQIPPRVAKLCAIGVRAHVRARNAAMNQFRGVVFLYSALFLASRKTPMEETARRISAPSPCPRASTAPRSPHERAGSAAAAGSRCNRKSGG